MFHTERKPHRQRRNIEEQSNKVGQLHHVITVMGITETAIRRKRQTKKGLSHERRKEREHTRPTASTATLVQK